MQTALGPTRFDIFCAHNWNLQEAETPDILQRRSPCSSRHLCFLPTASLQILRELIISDFSLERADSRNG